MDLIVWRRFEKSPNPLRTKQVLLAFIPQLLYGRLPKPAGNFWRECYLAGKWVACEALFDRALYEGVLKAGLVSRVQILTIDKDCGSDPVLLRPWIMQDVGPYFHSFEQILSRDIYGILYPNWEEGQREAVEKVCGDGENTAGRVPN